MRLLYAAVAIFLSFGAAESANLQYFSANIANQSNMNDIINDRSVLQFKYLVPVNSCPADYPCYCKPGTGLTSGVCMSASDCATAGGTCS